MLPHRHRNRRADGENELTRRTKEIEHVNNIKQQNFADTKMQCSSATFMCTGSAFKSDQTVSPVVSIPGWFNSKGDLKAATRRFFL